MEVFFLLKTKAAIRVCPVCKEHPAIMEILAHQDYLVNRATMAFRELSAQQAHLAQGEHPELEERREVPGHQEHQVPPALQVDQLF